MITHLTWKNTEVYSVQPQSSSNNSVLLDPPAGIGLTIASIARVLRILYLDRPRGAQTASGTSNWREYSRIFNNVASIISQICPPCRTCLSLSVMACIKWRQIEVSSLSPTTATWHINKTTCALTVSHFLFRFPPTTAITGSAIIQETKRLIIQQWSINDTTASLWNLHRQRG